MAQLKIGDKIAQFFNNLLYSSREKAESGLKAVTLTASLAALGLIIYAYGFEIRPNEQKAIYIGLDIIFLIFVLAYAIRFLYAFQRRVFLKTHWFEGLLMAFIVLNGVAIYVFQQRVVEQVFQALGFLNYPEFYRTFVTIYMVVLLGFEFIKASTNINRLKLKPATTFILSFLFLILIGTGGLMLPAMTVGNGSMPFLEALFTSTSAVCVTGLIVVDTATYFTTKGQFFIMVLFQIGGLGIISFATFFATFLKNGVGIKQQLMIQDFLSSESLFSARGTLKQIISITFIIEGFTILITYFSWGHDVVFESFRQKLFFSTFHAISAFCNAGFSLFSDGLFEQGVQQSYILHLVLILAVILGGIGFPVIQDILSPKNLKDRLKNPWKDWKLSSKIAVYVSLALLAFGTAVFYLLERENTLESKNFMEAFITSFFQSGSARTAGFNTVDFSLLKTPTLILIIFLMFIGASSSSVGGGIKTSTFYLIIASIAATLQGRSKIEIGKRFIPKELLFKALSVFFFAATLNLIGIFILSILEPKLDLIQLAFEQVSAIGTVGLSTGITPNLSDASRIVIIFSMFLGRVGTLTFALALSTRSASKSYRYPKAHLMVG